MTFISYAQNFEDVMLWRALRDVDRGFYIDVGAFSPDEDSVTRAFYDRGWSGINIEPNPKFFRELKERRAHDVNLQIAVSDKSGEAFLHVIGDTGLTTLESDIATAHIEKGWTETKTHIPTLTLEDVWSNYVAPGQDVHFLKIDVEGHEHSVIAGLDWTQRRPWIVVVEATVPNQPELSEDADVWSKKLGEADYRMVYWDGLNRFFVAAEHADLADAFSSPPNVFDGFTTIHAMSSVQRAEEAEARLKHYDGMILQACRDVEEARRDIRLCLDAVTALAEHAGRPSVLGRILATMNRVTRSNSKRRSGAGPTYLSGRPFWERLLFRESGKPKGILRRLLFHKSGKPRGIFRKRVLHPDGRPHSPFRKWMTSDQYRALPRAVRVSVVEPGAMASLSPNESRFLARLTAARKQGGQS